MAPRLSAALVAISLAACEKTGTIRVDWTFEGHSCARASVVFVRLNLDEETPRLLDCRDANETLGITLSRVSIGTHRLALSGLGPGGIELWRFSQDGIEVAAGAVTPVAAAFASTGAANPLQPGTPATRALDTAPAE